MKREQKELRHTLEGERKKRTRIATSLSLSVSSSSNDEQNNHACVGKSAGVAYPPHSLVPFFLLCCSSLFCRYVGFCFVFDSLLANARLEFKRCVFVAQRRLHRLGRQRGRREIEQCCKWEKAFLVIGGGGVWKTKKKNSDERRFAKTCIIIVTQKERTRKPHFCSEGEKKVFLFFFFAAFCAAEPYPFKKNKRKCADAQQTAWRVLRCAENRIAKTDGAKRSTAAQDRLFFFFRVHLPTATHLPSEYVEQSAVSTRSM